MLGIVITIYIYIYMYARGCFLHLNTAPTCIMCRCCGEEMQRESEMATDASRFTLCVFVSLPSSLVGCLLPGDQNRDGIFAADERGDWSGVRCSESGSSSTSCLSSFPTTNQYVQIRITLQCFFSLVPFVNTVWTAE